MRNVTVWPLKQATELNAHVPKGENGSFVVYANSITRPVRLNIGRACGQRRMTVS